MGKEGEPRGPNLMTPPITLFPQKALEFPLLKGHPNICVQARKGRQRARLGVRTSADSQTVTVF